MSEFFRQIIILKLNYYIKSKLPSSLDVRIKITDSTPLPQPEIRK